MKTFYAVVIVSLLSLAACQLNETSQSPNTYFNGPVKAVQQRVYGLNGNNAWNPSISVLPFGYAPARFPEQTFPNEILWIQAWEMQFDSLGTLLSKARFKGEGDKLQLMFYVKYAWDSLGRYEQIRGEPYQLNSNTYDSVARTYNPQTHILKQRHWKRGDDTSWYPMLEGTDSLLQIGDYPLVHFNSDTVLQWLSDSILDAENQGLFLIKKQRYGMKRVDTILYQTLNKGASQISTFSENYGTLREYDQEGHFVFSVDKTFEPDKDSLWEQTSYKYDTIAPYFFEERKHKFFAIGEWNLEGQKEQYRFDNQSRLLSWEEHLTQHGKTKLVYAYRFDYTEDGSSIRKDYLSYGTKLDLYELYTYDQYANPIGYEKQSGFLEGHKRDSIHASLDSLTYDAYGNWTQAVYTVDGSAYYRLERVFTYY